MKIGFIAVSHPDYLESGVAAQAALQAARILREGGVEVIEAGLVCNARQAENAGKHIVKQDADGVILFLASWMECPVAMSALRETEHLPLCLWGFPMMEINGNLESTGSYVSYAMFKGVLDRLSWGFRGILSPPDDKEAAAQALSFCRAAQGYQKMKRSRIGLVGYTSMSIYTGTFDHVLMRAKVGPEVDQMDSYSLIQKAESFEEESCLPVVEKIRNCARIRSDVSDKDLLKTARLYLALMSFKNERDWDAVNVKCQYEFSKEYGMVMCVPLSLAADSGIVSSCEGDILCTVSMLMLHFLSEQVVAYGDAMNHTDHTVKFSPCGFMPYSLGKEGEQEIRQFMPGVGFAGIQNSFVMRPGKVTGLRLIEDVGGYHLLYFTGTGLDTQLRQGYMPALDVKLDGEVSRFISNYSGQHYAICYGDLSAEIEDLSRILKIKTVKI